MLAPRLSPSTFAIVANGFADGPAQALRDYLIAREATVITILHPLTPENGSGRLRIGGTATATVPGVPMLVESPDTTA